MDCFLNGNCLHLIKSALFGLSVGDALGVPVETFSRSSLKRNPVKDMRGFGKHNQTPGTWSDDSSLSFCLAEALTEEFDLNRFARNLVSWYDQGYWTANGVAFDIGISTRKVLRRFKKKVKPELAGDTNDEYVGNGALMRILPLLFFIKDRPVSDRFELIKQVSSITHAQLLSIISCFYYLEYARLLITPMDKTEAYLVMKKEFIPILESLAVDIDFTISLNPLLLDNIVTYAESEIPSGGEVDETLLASIWCLLKTNSYSEAVLKAVNLGDDTDTTACVTGGLAGLLYGYDQIPAHWLEVLARKDDIEDLCNRLSFTMV